MTISNDAMLNRWMIATSNVHHIYCDIMEGYDSFAESKRTSLGVLIAGAERGDLVTLSQFTSDWGLQCDLYVFDPVSECEFYLYLEQAWGTLEDFYSKFDLARSASEKLESRGCTTSSYGVVLSLNANNEDERREIVENLRSDFKNSSNILFSFGDSIDPSVAILVASINLTPNLTN